MALVLVAVGGNALIREGQEGTAEEQFRNAMTTAVSVVQLLKAGDRVVLTHGNGPQVGAALIRSEKASAHAYRLPYDCCVASTQGEIGYMLQYALWQVMQREGLRIPVAALVTQVRVDMRDPAFTNPTKPVGPFYRRADAERQQAELGWIMKEIPRKGFRRVVPSPRPVEIIEMEAIRACVERHLVVIAGGGGGVPVSNDHDISKGVEAVIDKDLTSALLAGGLGADLFAIVTGEERVFLDYGKPSQRPIDRMDAATARSHLDAGQFPEGSMGPKVEAALDYLQQGGREVVVTDMDHLFAGTRGRAGTHIHSDAGTGGGG
ncbi:MAG: carbamate kinase [Bacteroidota bacterium]